MRPELALVPGEPAGIGPELCVRLVQQPREDCRLLAFADPDTLRAAAVALNLPCSCCPRTPKPAPRATCVCARWPMPCPATSARPTRPMPGPSSAPCSLPAGLPVRRTARRGHRPGAQGGHQRRRHRLQWHHRTAGRPGRGEGGDDAGQPHRARGLATTHLPLRGWPMRSPRPARNTPFAPCTPRCAASSACPRHASPCSA